MRVRSALAACTLRSQNASVIPTDGASAMAIPWRAGSRPMMWRTTTSPPNCPARRAGLVFEVSPAWLRPTRVLRTLASASRGWSSVMCRSASITSRALWPSSSVTTLPSHAVMVWLPEIGWQPCVTRDIRAAPLAKATPLRPPLSTPLTAPCPLTLPCPLSANCTAGPRLDARPPNT